MRFEHTVIARRFTIICLMAAIFGFVFATLVQSRPARSWEIGQVVPCVFEDGLVCKMPKAAK